MYMFDFFSVFGYQVFFATLISAASKKFRKCLPWNVSFCDPHNEGKPKNAFRNEVHFCRNSFFFKLQGSIISSRSQSGTSQLYKSSPIKKVVVLCFCVIIAMIRIFRKLLSFLLHLNILTFSQPLLV